MGNYNKNLKGIIELLVEKGVDILEVEVGQENLYFCVKSFDKPSTGSVSSSPYFRIIGWEVTDSLMTGANTNVEHVLSQLEKIRDSKKAKLQEFSDNHIWRFYTQS